MVDSEHDGAYDSAYDGGEYDAAQARLRGRRAATSATPSEILALVHGVLAQLRASDDAGDGGSDGSDRDRDGGGGDSDRDRGDGGGDGDHDSSGSGSEQDGGDGADRSGGGATIGPQDLLTALTLLRHLREQLASWEPELIAAARVRAVSWASLAPALGVTSRQAAERRYLRLQPSATGEKTGEDRVRAERTRRAGERAVAAWAREHSGVLRRLAGQISALEGLPSPAQQRVDIVHRALAGDDPAGLLGPLADTHDDLEATHGGLAEQVRSVTERTEQLRRDTEAQRAATQ